MRTPFPQYSENFRTHKIFSWKRTFLLFDFCQPRKPKKFFFKKKRTKKQNLICWILTGIRFSNYCRVFEVLLGHLFKITKIYWIWLKCYFCCDKMFPYPIRILCVLKLSNLSMRFLWGRFCDPCNEHLSLQLLLRVKLEPSTVFRAFIE